MLLTVGHETAVVKDYHYQTI